MHDDPLKQPGKPKAAGPMDAAILWGMVVLFGVVWVLMVWMNKHPGDAMTDPMSTGAPVGRVDPTVQSALLGMGLAIVGIGLVGGARDMLRASRKREGERKERMLQRPSRLHCPVCERDAPDGSRFCPHCGAAL